MAIVPGYISRSVAGSYDNEGIAIFALLFTYFLWLRSVKTGSVFWATAAALSYFYMVSKCTVKAMVYMSVCVYLGGGVPHQHARMFPRGLGWWIGNSPPLVNSCSLVETSQLLLYT